MTIDLQKQQKKHLFLSWFGATTFEFSSGKGSTGFWSSVSGMICGPNQLDSEFKLRQMEVVKLIGFQVRKGVVSG